MGLIILLLPPGSACLGHLASDGLLAFGLIALPQKIGVPWLKVSPRKKLQHLSFRYSLQRAPDALRPSRFVPADHAETDVDCGFNSSARINAALRRRQHSCVGSDPQWKGIANYHAGDFQRAVEAFAQQQTPDGYFNRGNALARSGNLEEALVAYETVLNTDPTHEDAAFNAALIRDLMKQQQRQSQRGQQGQNGKDAERQEPSVANNGTTGAEASSLEKPSAMAKGRKGYQAKSEKTIRSKMAKTS